MPGFYLKASANSKFYLQHFWLAIKIGNLNLDTPLMLQDVKLPSADFETHEQAGASIYYKFAKFAKYGDCTLTFYDLRGTIEQLEEWRKSIWEKEKGIAVKTKYAKDVVIQQTDGKGQAQVTHTLYNCWPRTIEHGLLSYDRSEAKLVIVTLAVDYMEVTK